MSSAAVNAQLRGSGDAGAEDSFALLEELSCPVCLGLYADPVVLPCGHAYCKECVAVLGATSQSAYLSCPNCRARHHLGEVSKLEPCHNLRRIIKNLDKLIVLDESMLADLAAMNLEEKLDSQGGAAGTDGATPSSAAEAARAERREEVLAGNNSAPRAGQGPLGLPLRVLSAPQQASLLAHWATAQKHASTVARHARRGANAAAETVVHLSKQVADRVQKQGGASSGAESSNGGSS